MKKLKKSLAILLAARMLASFMPLFASAATTTLNYRNCIILEAPKITYGDQVDVNKITVNYGVTPKDFTVTGGKLAYVASEGATPVEIPGTFSGASTIKLSVGDEVAISLKFTPTDTTTYSSPTVSKSFTMAEGVTWPTAKVIGQTSILDTAPTPSGTTVGLGARLSTITFSGGKVVDETGTEITGGRWRFVNNSNIMDTEGTFEEEYQWTKSGYEPIKLKMTVTVKLFKTTLAEAPTMSTLSVHEKPVLGASRASASSVSGGKVLDEDGNEVTGGTWKVTGYPDGITESSYLYTDTPVTLTWTKVGYQSQTAQATIHVTQGHSQYNIYSRAKLSISNQNLAYSPDQTWADEGLVIPAVIKDKNDVDVPGKWEIRHSANTTTVMDYAISASTSTRLVYIFFVPDDASLPEYYFTDTIGTVSKADFALSEDSVLVLNYGAAHQSPYSTDDNDFQFSTLKTVPEEAGVNTISWSKDIFDPATADYGSVTMVEVTVTPENRNYNSMKLTVPVKIQPYTITTWFDSNYGTSVFIQGGDYGDDAINGLITYRVDFQNIRLLGSVKVQATDGTNIYDIDTVDADETGKFYLEGKWQAPADGSYTFIYTYIPSENDTAIFSEEKFMTRTMNEAVEVDMKEMRTVTVKIGSTVYTEEVREGFAFNKTWSQITDLDSSVFASWVFTDASGNIIEVEDRHPAGVDYFTDTRLNFTMPEYDVVVTAKSASGEDVNDNALGGSLWSFWQKLINFIVEIYRTIMDFFVPAVEQY